MHVCGHVSHPTGWNRMFDWIYAIDHRTTIQRKLSCQTGEHAILLDDAPRALHMTNVRCQVNYSTRACGTAHVQLLHFPFFCIISNSIHSAVRLSAPSQLIFVLCAPTFIFIFIHFYSTPFRTIHSGRRTEEFESSKKNVDSNNNNNKNLEKWENRFTLQKRKHGADHPPTICTSDQEINGFSCYRWSENPRLPRARYDRLIIYFHNRKLNWNNQKFISSSMAKWTNAQRRELQFQTQPQQNTES